MSTISTTPTTAEPHAHGNGHNPYLAHHFDTPEQQMASGKLGMWVFLATEILMFGGLFCAYAVYRHNHPDVFEFAHQYLDKKLGAINTVVLITSSLTMAWGVRLAQLGKNRGLILTLALTILGGFLFMGIKTIEYKAKWEHHLGLGSANRYDPRYKPSEGGGHAAEHGALKTAASTGGAAEHGGAEPGKAPPQPNPAQPATVQTSVAGQPVTTQQGVGGPHPAATQHTVATINPDYHDPNAGTPDAAKIVPVAPPPPVLAATEVEQHRQAHASEEELEAEYLRLGHLDQKRTSTFFQIYFLMTGLHGIHVLIGMALIFWILIRAVPVPTRRTVMLLGLASIGVFLLYVGLLLQYHWPTVVIGLVVLLTAATGIALRVIKPQPAPVFAGGAVPLGYNGEFGPEYFAPVDIVGLYWHLVDLIWIFLFPLLYLIH